MACEYRYGLPEEELDILDFINLVFSQNRVPHHFEEMLAKMYGRPGFAPCHYVAKKDGRLCAVVGVLPQEIRLQAGKTLKSGYVGSVSVHTRNRGEGHMQELMRMCIADYRGRGYDMMALGGQRQRYGYYGFEQGCPAYGFTITPANIRHALKDVDGNSVAIKKITDAADPVLDALYDLYLGQEMVCHREREDFLTIMHSWRHDFYALADAATGESMGYLSARQDDIVEMALRDEGRLCQVIKAWCAMKNSDGFSVHVPFHQKERAEALKRFANGWSANDAGMILIFNWPRVLKLLLEYKAGKYPLESGRFVFEIQGEGRFALSVQGKNVSVAPTAEAPEKVFTPCTATEFFFSAFGALQYAADVPKNWLPLPLHIPRADKF